MGVHLLDGQGLRFASHMCMVSKQWLPLRAIQMKMSQGTHIAYISKTSLDKMGCIWNR